MKKLVITTDGAAVPNPGPAAIGATIKDEHGQLIASISQAIGQATNNQAEYRAIIAALETAIQLKADQVKLLSDSELIVQQVNGNYRVKNTALKPLYLRVKQLQSQLQSFTIAHIPSEKNEAHNLANAALE